MEQRLGISRTTRLEWERRGVLTPIRVTGTSHRRYSEAAVEALITAGTDSTSSPSDVDAAASSLEHSDAAAPHTPEAIA